MTSTLSRWLRRIGLKNETPVVYFANYALAIAYSLVILVPLYYLVAASFKSNREIFLSPLAWPTSFSFANYAAAFEKADLIKAMLTSLVVVIGTEIAVVVVGFPAAYAIARIRGKLATAGEVYFGIGFIIPTFAMLVPVFLMIAKSGLLFNPLALVLVYTAQTLAITVLLLAAVIRTIPRELEEAAMIDGAGRLQIMRRVMFPLARSGVVTVMILTFIFVWNEFIFALILLGRNVRTVQLAVPLLKGERLVDFGLLSAGVVISIVPVFIMFAFFQEKIVSGLTSGAVKG